MPDLPGCSAFGATPEAAVHEIGDAIEAWIAACRASGDPVPWACDEGPPHGLMAGACEKSPDPFARPDLPFPADLTGH